MKVFILDENDFGLTEQEVKELIEQRIAAHREACPAHLIWHSSPVHRQQSHEGRETSVEVETTKYVTLE